MTRHLSAAAFALALCTPGAAAAQTPLPISLEARGGVAIPTGDFKDLGGGIDNGWGFGGSVHVQVAPRVSVYGGYSQTEFDLESTTGTASDRGFEVGGRFAFPGVGYSPWVRGGLLFHDMEVERAGTELEGDNDPGFEIGAGAAFPLGPRVAVSPGVAYRRYSTDLPVFGEQNVSYLALDVGLRIRL